MGHVCRYILSPARTDSEYDKANPEICGHEIVCWPANADHDMDPLGEGHRTGKYCLGQTTRQSTTDNNNKLSGISSPIMHLAWVTHREVRPSYRVACHRPFPSGKCKEGTQKRRCSGTRHSLPRDRERFAAGTLKENKESNGAEPSACFRQWPYQYR